MKNILLLEDDKSLGEGLTERLTKDYYVKWAQNIAQAKSFIQSAHFDLAILDVHLPDGSGYEIAQLLKDKSRCQFLFLTAHSDAEARLKGFELGAQEFIPKPFYLKELLIRVAHVLENHSPSLEIKLLDRSIRFDEMSIQFNDGRFEYPPVTDMKVLKLLYEKSPVAVSRDEIFDIVWGKDKTPNLRTVDNIIVRIRDFVGPESEVKLRSVRGVGYQWLKNPNEGENNE